MPDALKADAVKKVLTRMRKLPENALVMPNAASATFTVIMPDGFTVEDMLQPMFWSHVARKFNPKFHYFIDVLNDEHTIYARLYVRAVQENQMIVEQIGETQHFGPTNVAAIGNLQPRWNVGRRGWDIVRSNDGEVVQEGSKFAVKEQALAWIDEHRRTFGAAIGD